MRSILPIPGLVLAGGLARRMGGGDKPLVAVGGRAMLDHVVARLRGQVEEMVINANGDPSRFSGYGLPVVADTIGGFAGPLAGILAGMRWTEDRRPAARFVASVPADTPFFPADLVERLAAACHDERTIALAASDGGTHPVFGLWPTTLADELEVFLGSGQGGKILAFADRYARRNVHFEDIVLPDGERFDPFFNVNTPEDAVRADGIAAKLDREAL